jgi:hypothetical protein
MALGSTQTLTEMNTRNISGGKWWPAGKADNLTQKMWEPRSLIKLWASTACSGASFTCYISIGYISPFSQRDEKSVGSNPFQLTP